MRGCVAYSLLRAPQCSRCVLQQDRKSTRLNSSHLVISYAVFCLKKKKQNSHQISQRTVSCLVQTAKVRYASHVLPSTHNHRTILERADSSNSQIMSSHYVEYRAC